MLYNFPYFPKLYYFPQFPIPLVIFPLHLKYQIKLKSLYQRQFLGKLNL